MAAIVSWDDWFASCEAASKSVAEYEDCAERYLLLTYGNHGAGRTHAESKMASRLPRRFWEADKPISGSVIGKGIGLGFGLVAVIAFVFVVIGVVRGIQAEDVMAGLASMVPWMLLCGVLALLLGAGIVIGTHVAKRSSLIRRMEALETKLLPIMQVLPPKYRNSFSLEVISEMWAGFGVETYEQAMDALMNYARTNPGAMPSGGIMGDVAFSRNPEAAASGTAETGDAVMDERAAWEARAKSIANLPPDIVDKTRAGAVDAEGELEELIGLDEVKEQVRRLRNRISFFEGERDARLGGNNLIFYGPPGSGKTAVARIVCKQLYDFGYVAENRITEIDGAYLRAPYVGQTAERTAAIIEWAKGGVLFIDEAYLLADQSNSGGFGAEATGVLLKAMEDMRDELVVILAGYEDDMTRLIASNEGFSSRVRHKLYFPEYSRSELEEIFSLMLSRMGDGVWSCEDGVLETLSAQWESERGLPSFANGRTVRNALDSLLDIHADRFMRGEISESSKYVIEEADAKAYVEQRRSVVGGERRNEMGAKGLDAQIVSTAELKGRVRHGEPEALDGITRLPGCADMKAWLEDCKTETSFLDAVEPGLVAFVGSADSGRDAGVPWAMGYLSELNVLDSDKYLLMPADFLRASYVGQTARRVDAICSYASGGALVISGVSGFLADDGFAAEALSALVGAVQQGRVPLVVLSCTEDELAALVHKSASVDDMLTREIYFNGYDLRELCEVVRDEARGRGLKVEREAWLALQRKLRPYLGEDGRFGSSVALDALSGAISRHGARINAGEVSDTMKKVLQAQDFAEE